MGLMNRRRGVGSRLGAGKERNREGRRFRSSILSVPSGLAEGFLFWQNYSMITLFCQFGHKASRTVGTSCLGRFTAVAHALRSPGDYEKPGCLWLSSRAPVALGVLSPRRKDAKKSRRGRRRDSPLRAWRLCERSSLCSSTLRAAYFQGTEGRMGKRGEFGQDDRMDRISLGHPSVSFAVH